MLLYAWKLPQFLGTKSIELEDSPDLPNLLARVLSFATRAQLRRGIHRDFVDFEDRLRYLRGRVDLLGSARRLELIHGTATCRYDELVEDNLANRILKASLLRLASRPRLHHSLRQTLRALASRLASVQPLASVPAHLFSQVRIGRNNASYRLLLEVCRLVWNLKLPLEDSGVDPFSGLLKDELRMSTVFESFVRNFYRQDAEGFKVGYEWLEWPTSGNRRYLPGMKTDVSLTGPDRRIVIDTKYYYKTLVERDGYTTLHSGHLYQLFAYLRTQEGRGRPFDTAEGILLYPTVESHVHECYQIQGHEMTVATLDLSSDWQSIEARLRSLLDRSLNSVA
jgi:5-methylcytosine-specific restriction enzyme subunit McrC